MFETLSKESPTATELPLRRPISKAAKLKYLAKLVDEQGWTEKDWQAKRNFESWDRQRRIQALFVENPTISFRETLLILIAELLPESASDAETVEFFDDSKKWFEHFKPAVPA